MDSENNRADNGEILEHHRSVGIFIKTWIRDLPWLEYCLRSISRFATGFDDLVIMADDDCRGSSVLIGHKVHYCPVAANGYMYQQICKLNADRLLKTDLILFVDSDCVFTRPVTPLSFMFNGKPVLLKESWSRFSEGHPVHCWKEITERHTTWQVEFEYMRRLPLIHDRMALEIIRSRLPDLTGSLMQRSDREFSEFNLIGAYADRIIPGRYHMIEVGRETLPEKVAEQYWSWGGIDDSIRLRIEEALA